MVLTTRGSVSIGRYCAPTSFCAMPKLSLWKETARGGEFRQIQEEREREEKKEGEDSHGGEREGHARLLMLSPGIMDKLSASLTASLLAAAPLGRRARLPHPAAPAPPGPSTADRAEADCSSKLSCLPRARPRPALPALCCSCSCCCCCMPGPSGRVGLCHGSLSEKPPKLSWRPPACWASRLASLFCFHIPMAPPSKLGVEWRAPAQSLD